MPTLLIRDTAPGEPPRCHLIHVHPVGHVTTRAEETTPTSAGFGGHHAGAIARHARGGYRRIGMLEAAGFPFSRWLDSVWMQHLLGAGDRRLPGAP